MHLAQVEHPRTSCFLAMVCWQLAEKETARQHYDDAVELLGIDPEAAGLDGEETK